MKKLFLFAAIAILGLASCTDEQIEGNKNDPSKKIQFKTMVGKNNHLKVTELTTDGLKADPNGFTVTALNSASSDFDGTNAYTSYINQLPVTWNSTSSTWTYTGAYYWPEDSYKLSFFAYGGDAVTSWAATTPSFPSFSYTIKSDASTQKDLVAAMQLNKTNIATALALDFKHILTQINFSLKGQVSGFKYVVKKIEILDAKNSGTYTYDATVGGWSTVAGTANYTYFTGNTTIDYNNSDFIPFGDGGSGAKALMLMPQNLTNVKIQVTYDIINTGGSFVKENKVAQTTLSSGAWELGKKLRYNITLPVATNMITFTATVENWQSETPSK